MNSENLLIDPQLLFQKAHLHPGMYVADFGTERTGHLVFPAAVAVGKNGLVYAVDVLKSVLESISKRAELESLLNIHTIWSDLEQGKTAIPKKSLDVIFLVNTLSFSHNPSLILQEAQRLLREKSRLVIVDWKKKVNAAFGPHDDNVLDFSLIKQWALQEGFQIQEEFSVGKFHHGIVFYHIDYADKKTGNRTVG